MADKETALIVGVGPNLSASVARLCAAEGMQVALAARDTGKLDELCKATNAKAYSCDVADPASVAGLFKSVEGDIGVPDLVVYNPSARVRGAVTEVDPEEVRRAITITCFGGFLVGQQAARGMLERGSGTILFTGASASVKGFANSSVFAMGKWGLRGLAQALARELQPQNIHVGHIVIDGGIGIGGDTRPDNRGPDGWLHPDEIARNYLHLHRQHRSTWSWEIELRPWTEKF